MWSLLLAGVLALQLCVVKSSSSDLTDCMKIKHEITEDEYFGYRRISIECRVIKCDVLEKLYFNLNSLTLSRKGYGKEDMAILERNKEKEKKEPDSLKPLPDLPEDASIIGYTDNIKAGHLIVEWKTKDYEKVDTFTCTMVVLNDYLQLKTVTISAEVDLNEPTYKELKMKTSSLQTEIDELKGKCYEKKDQSYVMTEEPHYVPNEEPPRPDCPPDEFKQKLIETFFGFKIESGRYYYMSSYNFTDDVESGKICSIVDGYLAEINDEDELKVLINFVKNSQQLGALVGGRFDTDNKKWVYMRSGKDVDYFKWKENKPENPVRKNCMGLWHEYELAEKNLPCTDNMYGLPFICEVENPY